MALDLSQFQVVFDDKFGNDTSLDKSLWSDSWGYANQFSFGNGALTLTGYEKPYWQSVAIMQRATGKRAGEGYGLYQFTGYANRGQGAGINFIMWRADNVWLDANTPNKASEIDVLESWDGTRTGNSVVHYYNTGWAYNDGQTYHPFTIDLAKTHTYAVDWERGSLTYYIDGKELYQDTTHVPLDYADGGCNEVMGAQVTGEKANVTTPTVQLHIVEMSYSAKLSAPPPAVTLGGGSQTYLAVPNTTVTAGAGSDTIMAAGGVSVIGGAGLLNFIGGSGANTVSGGTGSATLYGGSGGGLYAGGSAGANQLVSAGASGVNTTLTGAGAGDVLFGSAAGTDHLVAGAGPETLVGGGGSTQITGGSTAASVIFTAGGATSVSGGAAGGDSIVGGGGTLDVSANHGDAVFGGSGTLRVTGSRLGADSVVGGAGTMSVSGQGGNMLVVTGAGDASIDTGTGASLIYVQGGHSTISGGSGSMQVDLGTGAAQITEGTGAVSYDVVRGSAGGADMINGFRPGADTINLYGYAASDRQVSQSGGSTLLSLADGSTIQIIGVIDLGTSLVG